MKIIMNPDDRKLWWIASYPKSGNTWVRMFLNAYLSGFPVDFNTAFQYAMSDLHGPPYQAASVTELSKLSVRQQFYYRTAALMNILAISPCKDVCLKTHHAMAAVEDIPLIPEKVSSGAIYIIRDPRDVAISFADHMGTSINAAIEALNNIQQSAEKDDTKLISILLTWSKHVESWTIKNKKVPTTCVRYEDMLDDTENQFVRILNGLGFSNINEGRFQFALKQTEFSNMQRLEEKIEFKEKGKGEKFFRKGTAGQWKSVLTKRQIEKIESDHGEVMSKFGYELTQVTL